MDASPLRRRTLYNRQQSDQHVIVNNPAACATSFNKKLEFADLCVGSEESMNKGRSITTTTNSLTKEN